VDEAEAQAAYPYRYWGLAKLLAAPVERVCNWVRQEVIATPGLEVHVLEVGPRDNDEVATTSSPSTRWLAWNESDTPATLDLALLAAGGGGWTVYDAESGADRSVLGTSLDIGDAPVVLERAN
jgi:hypothetical protein